MGLIPGMRHLRAIAKAFRAYRKYLRDHPWLCACDDCCEFED